MIILLGKKQISAAEGALSFPTWGWENWIVSDVSELRNSLSVYQGTVGSP